MKLLRIGMLVGAGMLARRALEGRATPSLHRVTHAGRARLERGTSSGTHSSAASAANNGYRDDRDVVGAGAGPVRGNDAPPGGTR